MISVERASFYQRSRRAVLSAADRWQQSKRTYKRLGKLHAADAVVVSYPKSGRTWLAAMISHLYHQRYGIDPSKILRFDNFHRLEGATPRIFFTHDQRPSSALDRMMLAGERPLAPVERYAGKKVVWLVRNPRDVAVSAYFHVTRRSWREQPRGAAPTRPPPLLDYVLAIELPRIIAFMARWEANIGRLENALILRYEDLHRRPATGLASAIALLDRPFPRAMIEQAVAFGSFESLRRKEAARFFASERLQPGRLDDPDSFKVRRGKVGGHRDYFSPGQLARIEAALAGRLSDRFGYRQPPAAPGG